MAYTTKTTRTMFPAGTDYALFIPWISTSETRDSVAAIIGALGWGDVVRVAWKHYPEFIRGRGTSDEKRIAPHCSAMICMAGMTEFAPDVVEKLNTSGEFVKVFYTETRFWKILKSEKQPTAKTTSRAYIPEKRAAVNPFSVLSIDEPSDKHTGKVKSTRLRLTDKKAFPDLGDTSKSTGCPLPPWGKNGREKPPSLPELFTF